MLRWIPSRFVFRYFHLGAASLVLFLVVIAGVYLKPFLPVSSGILSIISYFWVASLLVYLVAEGINVQQRILYLEHKYAYGSLGVYRDGVLIMKWLDISNIIFKFESRGERANPNALSGIGATYGTDVPARARKVKEATITVIGRSEYEKLKVQIHIRSTLFRPLFTLTYRRLKKRVDYSGAPVAFDYRHDINSESAES